MSRFCGNAHATHTHTLTHTHTHTTLTVPLPGGETTVDDTGRLQG